MMMLKGMRSAERKKIFSSSFHVRRSACLDGSNTNG